MEHFPLNMAMKECAYLMLDYLATLLFNQHKHIPANKDLCVVFQGKMHKMKGNLLSNTCCLTCPRQQVLPGRTWKDERRVPSTCCALPELPALAGFCTVYRLGASSTRRFLCIHHHTQLSPVLHTCTPSLQLCCIIPVLYTKRLTDLKYLCCHLIEGEHSHLRDVPPSPPSMQIISSVLI